jgi:hypothetical protein
MTDTIKEPQSKRRLRERPDATPEELRQLRKRIEWARAEVAKLHEEKT